MDTNRDLFIGLLKSVSRRGVDNVLDMLDSKGFYVSPASIKYQNNYEGGLLDHSIAVYKNAVRLRDLELEQHPQMEDTLHKESIILAALLHDVCKSDVYHKDSRGKWHKDISAFPAGHGEKSVIMLLQCGLELTPDEILAIRWHMGEHEIRTDRRGQEAANYKVALEKCALLRLLQKADSNAAVEAMAPAHWDSKMWCQEFDAARENIGVRARTDALHAARTKVFRSTVDIVLKGGYVTENGKKVSMALNKDIAAQTVFCEREIAPMVSVGKKNMKVEVVGQDCLEFAGTLVRNGAKEVCVLNLASYRNPGGGVSTGAGAQEEYLFRCSDYFRSLYQYVDYAGTYGVTRNPNHSYPLQDPLGGVFSRGVTIFRDTESNGYRLIDEPWQVNFIAVAAHRNPKTVNVDGQTRLAPAEEQVMYNKVRTILRIAVRNGQQTLVLGALGCGAFHNPPKHVAQIFKAVLAEPEFDGAFDAVYFAIIDDHNSNGNLALFREVFGESDPIGKMVFLNESNGYE